MAAPKRLRAVTAGDAAVKPRLTITQAADAGDQRELLVALRARLAKTVEDPTCPPRDLAALTRRLTDINHDIEALDARARQEAAEDAHLDDEAWDASAL